MKPDATVPVAPPPIDGMQSRTQIHHGNAINYHQTTGQLTAQQPAKPAPQPQGQDKQKAHPRSQQKLARNRGLISKADRETKEYIIENLSMLLSTGVTVSESIESIAKELPSKSVRTILMTMLKKIDDGVPFAVALGETGLFNESVVKLVEVGESSGRLPDNLHVIAQQMHKTNVMAAKIKSAMLYPAFLVGLLFVVGTGVGVFLLPRLLSILQGLNVKVGLTTQILMVVGTFMGKYGLLVAVGVVVLLILLGIIIKLNLAARIIAESVLFHIIGIKRLLFETEVARFGFILGTLLDAGLPVVVALQSLAGSMATHRYRSFAKKISISIEEGNSFATTLERPENKKLLPSTIRQLIISAEKSGNLSRSLVRVGEIYEDKADITARNLETLLEPIILVLIAVAVLFVALAVILPIYSLVGGISQ